MNDQFSQPPPPTTPPLSPVAGGPPPGQPRPQPQPNGAMVPSSWGPARVAGGIGFLVVTYLVLGTIVFAFDADADSLAATLVLQAALGVVLTLTAFLFAGPDIRGFAKPAVLGLRKPLRRAGWLAVATYFGYVGCAVVLALLLSPDQEDITRELGGDDGVGGSIIAGFLIIIVAPITEEIFFRGFLYPGLKRGLPAVVAAVMASAIWGLVHYTGPGTWGVVVQITVFGLWLTWLYERTGSILPTIAVHAVNNAVAFAFLLNS